jgi:hypothetical protein
VETKGKGWTTSAICCPARETDGKRKFEGGEGTEGGKGELNQNGRLKQKKKTELMLRDEDETLENGSGMAGSDLQPRRPV